MQYNVTLHAHDDFAGFRAAARAIIQHGIDPAQVCWSVGQSTEPDLFQDKSPLPAYDGSKEPMRAPAAFVEQAKTALCHNDPDRFYVLATILRRLKCGEKYLLQQPADPDVKKLYGLIKEVNRASHKMKAFVRFREIELPETGMHYISWFEPPHFVLRRTAPFFAKRFASMNWSIFTPDLSAHWNGRDLLFTGGVTEPPPVIDDKMETAWLSYYKSIFNPARIKQQAMQSEMPKQYWHNLPEAKLIPDLLSGADARVLAMIKKNG